MYHRDSHSNRVRLRQVFLYDRVREEIYGNFDYYPMRDDGTWVCFQQHTPPEFIEALEQVCGKPINTFVGERLLKRADPHKKMARWAFDKESSPFAYYRREGTGSEAGYTLFVARDEVKTFFRIIPTEDLEKA
jgi:hypothetical protein